MIASICLLSCALAVGQGSDRAEWQLAPQLMAGLELVYQGSYVEESLIPNVQYQKQFRLETNLLVLEGRAKDWRVALLTALSMQDPRQPFDKKYEGPMSVRLEMANIDFQGCLTRADKKPLELPLKGPPTVESGFLLAAPLTKVGRYFRWESAEKDRPTMVWQVLGTESCGGIHCIKVAGVQQSEDWEHGRADQAAWRRRDTLWILPQLNVAQKVERLVERRDPARDTPTHRTVVRYELESRLKYPGSLFAERRQEVLLAKKFYDEAEPFLQHPVYYRPQIENMLQRVASHLERPAATNYRKAFVHIKALLENARKGETPVPEPVEDPIAHNIQALTIGQRAPDFMVSSFTEDQTTRLQSFLGKPVLLLFYNPATPTGKDVIEYAKQLREKRGEAVAVMAMAVTPDADIARKQHQELRLPFPILDGNGMRLTFGVDQTPRIVLLDGRSYVRLVQTGWGLQTPYEIDEELRHTGASDAANPPSRSP